MDNLVNNISNLFKSRTDRIGAVARGTSLFFRIRIPDQEIPRYLLRHLKGHQRIGFYNFLPDGTCYWSLIEFERKESEKANLEKAMLFKKTLLDFGIKSYLERSHTETGFRLWLFYDRKIEATQARLLVKEILKKLNLSEGINIYPSEETENAGENVYGDYAWLPFFGGMDLIGKGVKNEHSLFIDDSGKTIPVDVSINLIKPNEPRLILDVINTLKQQAAKEIIVEEKELLPSPIYTPHAPVEVIEEDDDQEIEVDLIAIEKEREILKGIMSHGKEMIDIMISMDIKPEHFNCVFEFDDLLIHLNREIYRSILKLFLEKRESSKANILAYIDDNKTSLDYYAKGIDEIQSASTLSLNALKSHLHGLKINFLRDKTAEILTEHLILINSKNTDPITVQNEIISDLLELQNKNLTTHEMNDSVIVDLVQKLTSDSSSIISTGFKSIDEAMNGGLLNGKIVEVKGQSYIEGTIFTLQIIDQIAQANPSRQTPVIIIYISHRFDKEELILKSISRIEQLNECLLEAKNWKKEQKSDEYISKKIILAGEAYHSFGKWIMVIRAKERLNLKKVETIARQLNYKFKTKNMVIVIEDPLLTLENSPRETSSNLIVRTQLLAREMNIPIIFVTDTSSRKADDLPGDSHGHISININTDKQKVLAILKDKSNHGTLKLKNIKEELKESEEPAIIEVYNNKNGTTTLIPFIIKRMYNQFIEL